MKEVPSKGSRSTRTALTTVTLRNSAQRWTKKKSRANATFELFDSFNSHSHTFKTYQGDKSCKRSAFKWLSKRENCSNNRHIAGFSAALHDKKKSKLYVRAVQHVQLLFSHILDVPRRQFLQKKHLQTALKARELLQQLSHCGIGRSAGHKKAEQTLR
jgi:hypothetical protein